jgi:acyl-CoA reductase-like NAD-dependent aldehyde dehydrogenase
MCVNIWNSPVCSIERFSDFKQACEIVNDSVYGLQAGLFTNNIHKSFYAFKHLDVGGVVINDVPSVRVDSQPVIHLLSFIAY